MQDSLISSVTNIDRDIKKPVIVSGKFEDYE